MTDDRSRSAHAKVRDVFDDWALEGRGDQMEESHAPFVRQAFGLLDLARDGWYLDIGCGNGYTVRWAARVAPGGRATGIDLSPQMVALARRRSAAHSNVEYHVAAFPDHPLPAARFDAILSMEVFYYLPDLHAALVEVRRLLAPGGRFACVVDYYAENTAAHDWPADVGLDMTLLDEAGWRAAFERAGLVVVEQRRLRVPAEGAHSSWQVTEGSLLTMGRRT